ncbi:endonuclease/exonuclease/phosphatase family protein [Cellulomonas fimi]|uniref:Endonuclease/exonuclease/phosphatase n=1 Tax=Cellulomonas fimi (strain ATCC 484 / DSM 20113 / JCM 1341 / CCUG 24087 / LMG 16345 / NBRC 15513 / NCIMB 8980 / NCTC 7547 / NRS-133) TaxID=590998 RepID=F4H0M5_CELFA|nr:endonuclease/exonuclease/phosphatase family protein [Cellulomonas fimi]AEE44998.1 Endonuclease/exonuclease/phosphatase [Cellulomonas fimi ATCC 484]NNH08979.1 endonuclease/exonuclease/phosphatase [Cellulomonas fimi]VEH27926.1 Uncharacterized protein conserved in bacteria [Cellulomonas fimi]
MRLMTYNVKGLQLDGRAVAQVVRQARPDVLAVQEPPRGLPGRWRVRRFARRAGLRVVVNGRGSRTTALLVAPGLHVSHAHALRLPWREGTVRRGAAVARVEGVVVAAVHLSLVRDERAQHLELLLRHLAAAPPAPRVVLGDLNEPPDGPAWHRLLEGLVDACPDGPPTYPAVDASLRIDAVLVDPSLTVRSAAVHDDDLVLRASDHRPLVVDVEPAAPPV